MPGRQTPAISPADSAFFIRKHFRPRHHSILVIAYYIIKRKEPYRELGSNHFDESDRRAVERRLIKRLERLGNQVTVEPMAKAS